MSHLRMEKALHGLPRSHHEPSSWSTVGDHRWKQLIDGMVHGGKCDSSTPHKTKALSIGFTMEIGSCCSGQHGGHPCTIDVMETVLQESQSTVYM